MTTLDQTRLTTPSRARAVVALALAAAGLALLVAVSFLLVRAEQPLYHFTLTGDDSIDRLITAQVTMLTAVVLIALVTRRLLPDAFAQFFRLGDMAAPVGAVRLLGISDKESWRRLGLTFAVVISAVTAIVTLVLPAQGTSFGLTPVAIVAVLLLAASNAFVEEYLTRFQVVAALIGRLRPAAIALVSGVFFGVPHFFGMPGGVLGMILAGFLGWFLAKSVIETRGLGWALVIHFVQDVIIFSAILGLR